MLIKYISITQKCILEFFRFFKLYILLYMTFKIFLSRIWKQELTDSSVSCSQTHSIISEKSQATGHFQRIIILKIIINTWLCGRGLLFTFQSNSVQTFRVVVINYAVHLKNSIDYIVSIKMWTHQCLNKILTSKFKKCRLKNFLTINLSKNMKICRKVWTLNLHQKF